MIAPTFDFRSPEPAPVGGRVGVRVDAMQHRDREWYARGLEVAADLLALRGELWPDDWSEAMRERGHHVGANLGAFWAWLTTQGFKQGDRRRMSRDPERNGAKVFVWGRA